MMRSDKFSNRKDTSITWRNILMQLSCRKLMKISNAALWWGTSSWVRMKTNWYRNPSCLSEINLFCWCIYFIEEYVNWVDIWRTELVQCFSYGAIVAFDFESDVIERSTMLEFVFMFSTWWNCQWLNNIW